MMRRVVQAALLLLVFGLFATMTGLVGAAYVLLGIPEADSRLLEMGTLALFIGAFCVAITIMDRRQRR